MDPNQAIISWYITELNKRNYSILDELVAPEVLVGSDKITKDQYILQIKARIDEFPDYFVKINKIETKNDVVVLYWHRSGTSKNTGEKLDEELMSEYKIINGRICEVH
jgi:hypothetical protein